MDRRNRLSAKPFTTVLLSAWILAAILCTYAEALRGLGKGDRVTDMTFVGISGEGGALSSFVGEKGLVVIYWATWSSRSPSILGFAEKDLKRYESLGLKFLAVNADHQEMGAEEIATVKAKAAELALSFPVVLDAGLEGYNRIGIITVPTTLVLGPDLVIREIYPGFPSVARDEIPERLDALLGIEKKKRPEKTQYLLDHKPKNHALQFYNLGKALFSMARSPSGRLPRVPENAIDRLDEAIRRDPDFFGSYLLKAIIFDKAGDTERRDRVLQEIRDRDFQEAYERRVLGFGYLYMGMVESALEQFRVLAAQVGGDPGILFGRAAAAAMGKNEDEARQAVEALRGLPEASEFLGFDPSRFFTETGTLAPDTEKEIKESLEVLLEIEKKSRGRIRKDAPVQPPHDSYLPRAPASMYSFAELIAVAASPAPAAMRRTFPG